MTHSQSALRCLLAVVVFGSTLEAKTESVSLRWRELAPAVTGRRVTVELSAGMRLHGVISAVAPDALLMDVLSSSPKGARPPGQSSIPRGEIATIRVRQIRGHGRLVGTVGAGTAAALGTLPWAISDSRVNVSDSSRVASWAAITAGAAIAGYFLGRAIDSRETEIRILPGD